MTPAQILKRDNLLVDFICNHKGRENVVSAKEICSYLNSKGYEARPSSIGRAIRKVMLERHLPICSENAKGYYWATSKEDILLTINDLQGRIEEMQTHIDHLKSFIIN